MNNKKRAKDVSDKVRQAAGGASSVWSSVLGRTTKIGGPQAADWSEVDAAQLLYMVHLASRNEGAVMCGISRDGTQYHVRMYGGPQPENFWFAGNEDGVALLEEWMREICAALEAAGTP